MYVGSQLQVPMSVVEESRSYVMSVRLILYGTVQCFTQVS